MWLVSLLQEERECADVCRLSEIRVLKIGLWVLLETL